MKMHMDVADMTGFARAQLMVLQHHQRMAYEHVDDNLLFDIGEFYKHGEKSVLGQAVSSLEDEKRHASGHYWVKQVHAFKLDGVCPERTPI
jgi:hypothetical protein